MVRAHVLKEQWMRLTWLSFLSLFLFLCLGGCIVERRPGTLSAVTAPAVITPSIEKPVGSTTVQPTTPLTLTTTITPTTTPLPLATGGTYVALAGRRLALYCTGEGSPTVLLEAGLGADHRSWELVQPGVAALTRVCSYDRASLGASDGAGVGRTGAEVAADLAQLLTQSGEQGPFILVGHSFGALFVRLYTAEHPDDVIGVIFVDAVHEQWWERAAALLPPPSATDSARLQNFRTFMTTGYRNSAQTAEGLDIPATVAQVATAGDLGDRPLLVLVAGIPTVIAPGLPVDLETQLNQLLQQTLPDELLGLSSFSIRLPVDDSGHNIPQEQPDAVFVAVRTMLDVLRMGQ